MVGRRVSCSEWMIAFRGEFRFSSQIAMSGSRSRSSSSGSAKDFLGSGTRAFCFFFFSSPGLLFPFGSKRGEAWDGGSGTTPVLSLHPGGAV